MATLDEGFVSYENIEDGAYLLAGKSVGLITENVRYASAEFNKLYASKVRLPDGASNIVYILSSNFENTISMINKKHFILPTSYKKFFYPMIMFGKFMGRRLSFNVRKDIKIRNDEIKQTLNMRPYALRSLPKGTENVIFCTSDVYSAAVPIMSKFSVSKNYTSFFEEFFKLIDSITPAIDPKYLNNKNKGQKVLVIDCESFSFKPNASLAENKTNPLYLLYMAFLRTKDLSKINVDIDILVCYKNLFYKFNPSRLTSQNQFSTFKRILFRIMNADLDDYNNNLTDKEKEELSVTPKENSLDDIVNKAIDPYVQNISDATKQTLGSAVKRSFQHKVANIAALDKSIKDVQSTVSGINTEQPQPDIFQKVMNDKSFIHTNPVVNPLSKEKEKLFNSIGSQYMPLTTKSSFTVDGEDGEESDIEIDDEDIGIADNSDETFDDEESIENDMNEILTSDEEVVKEVLDDIQERTVPLSNHKTSPVNGARDQKLREEQKKLVVKSRTIEEILAQDNSIVSIEVDDKSAVMHTTNQNMHKIKFANFNKTYLEKMYDKQILACFDMLKDQDSPFYITGIDVKDTSDSLNLKETWTVNFIDENKKKSTMKVDIPKFINNKFMLYQGTQYIVLNQNMYNPLVKDTPDEVIITTNFYKITVGRKATKSMSMIERIFTLAKKSKNQDMFVFGDSSKSNINSGYISSLEYDELSRRIFKFSNNNCEIYFSRDYLSENMEVPSGIKGNEFFIGTEGKSPIFINEDTGLDRVGRTIIEIIEANLDETDKILFNSIKAPAQSMYAECKLAGQYVPVIVVLLVWAGLKETLTAMGIKWTFTPGSKKVLQQTSSSKYIRFADGILEYEPKIFAELILNGLSKLHSEKLTFNDFETEECYADYIYSQWGTYNGILEVSNFKNFLIDPITKDTCKAMSLPEDPVNLLIYAVKLLSDNSYLSKASDKSYRTRSLECIPGILYSCIAGQYKQYIKRGRRIPMTVKQSCVFDRLISEKMVDTYSTLNPAIEVAKSHTISPKGYRGSNSEHSYDEKKRSYDPSSIGKIAITTSADANVGINRSLTIDPTITNVMGYRDQVDDVESLKDINVFSPIEMLTPATIRFDDPIRSAIAAKQSQHVVPVIDAAPSLISNGYDEAIQFELSDDFVINAEEDGKVIDVNEELGFIVVEYKSGKKKAINIKPKMVYNSGSGVYMSNQLEAVYTKVGQKFKKDMPLAYHPKFFKLSKMNGLRYAFGPITKVAFMSTFNTYEDGGVATESLAERMASSMVYNHKCKFKRNNNILNMVKIGDHVNIGDTLVKFDVSSEDNEIAKYLTKLSDENAALLEEQTKNDIKSKHAGVVVDIQVNSLLDPSNLSPSLANIVQSYFNQGTSKKEYLSKFDDSEGIIKAGYVLTDSTEPVKNKYNAIKGLKGVDVLIEIFIEHKDILGVGDKVALHTANKQIISQKIPKGYEPYSEFRPDEEISVLTSPGTLERRMTKSVVPIAAGFKCLIELKRKIKEEIKYK